MGSPTSYKQPPLNNITIFLLQEYVDLSSKRKVYLAANLKIYATQIVHLKALMFLIAYFAGVCTVSTFFYISTFRISLYCNFVHCLFLYHGFVFVFFYSLSLVSLTDKMNISVVPAKLSPRKYHLDTNNIMHSVVFSSTRTFIFETNNPVINNPGYNFFRCGCSSGTQRGDVCIYYKEHLPIFRRDDLCVLNKRSLNVV